LKQFIKNIFIFIFAISTISLTAQSTVISCFKDDVLKTQFQRNTPAEEEEETHKNQKSYDEILLFITNDNVLVPLDNATNKYLNNSQIKFKSFSKKIIVPPPEC
jgi:UDP-2,3-diacylglucosamine pyrophosphatase LpxH